MIELYLIAHKVRGEPAFDIACKLDCPECATQIESGCGECDFTSFWWIVPTSGHRAYPYFDISLDALMYDTEISMNEIDPARLLDEVPTMPPSLPDHYLPTAEPKAPSLLDRLNLRPTQPPIIRRF